MLLPHTKKYNRIQEWLCCRLLDVDKEENNQLFITEFSKPYLQKYYIELNL